MEAWPRNGVGGVSYKPHPLRARALTSQALTGAPEPWGRGRARRRGVTSRFREHFRVVRPALRFGGGRRGGGGESGVCRPVWGRGRERLRCGGERAGERAPGTPPGGGAAAVGGQVRARPALRREP